MSLSSVTIGPECLIGFFIVTTSGKGLEIFEIQASPLPGWYLCSQVNDREIQASVLFRLEDLKGSNTLFFETEDEAKEVLPSLSEKSVGEALGGKVPHRP